MKTLKEARIIIHGCKCAECGDGYNSMVLTLKGWNDELHLDLSKLDEEMLAKLQVKKYYTYSFEDFGGVEEVFLTPQEAEEINKEEKVIFETFDEAAASASE